MNKNVTGLLVILSLILTFSGCRQQAQESEGKELTEQHSLNKKLFLAISYHEDYSVSSIYTEIIGKAMTEAGVEVRTYYLDSKNIQDEKILKERALEAKKMIDRWKPDIMIATDDAINKYLVMPYYKDSALPIIFMGVNWDASIYGYPYSNVSGQVEVEQVESLIRELKKYSKGDRLGFLSADSLTNKKSLSTYRKRYGIEFDRIALVKSFADWKREFITMQSEVDMLFLRNIASIPDWDEEAAKAFIKENTEIITGAVNSTIPQYALISFCKLESEYAEYAARIALEVLRGRDISTIPISNNIEAKVYINTTLAKKLKIKFPFELLDRAHLLSLDKKKLFYVNSYHRGYKWSDDIEKGLLKALNIKVNVDGSLDSSESQVDIRIFHMDSKMNTSEDYIKGAALKAKAIIEEWQPDIVVTSDDNAAKHLIVPYYKESNLPFIFCGINWDASIYGLPFTNATGMLEVTPIQEGVELLKRYVEGRHYAFIGADNLSNRKEMDNIKKLLDNPDMVEGLTKSFDQWKKLYKELQEEVDIIIWTAPTGMKDWNSEEALEFIYANTEVPTLGTSDDNVNYSTIGLVKIAEEQGWWSGKKALEILDGKTPAEIPVVTNKESRLYLNMRLVNKLKIKLPVELLEEATFIDE